jgi:hypothetical protein
MPVADQHASKNAHAPQPSGHVRRHTVDTPSLLGYRHVVWTRSIPQPWLLTRCTKGKLSAFKESRVFVAKQRSGLPDAHLRSLVNAKECKKMTTQDHVRGG